MRAAVGTSLLVITANSLASLATRSGAAVSLDWAVIGPFIATAVLGAWDGKHLAPKVSGPTCNASSPSSCWPWPPSCSPTR